PIAPVALAFLASVWVLLRVPSEARAAPESPRLAWTVTPKAVGRVTIKLDTRAFRRGVHLDSVKFLIAFYGRNDTLLGKKRFEVPPSALPRWTQPGVHPITFNHPFGAARRVVGEDM